MFQNIKQLEQYQRKDLCIFGFNLILFMFFCYYTFSKNHKSLLIGLDGSYMMEIVRQQYQWGLLLFTGFTNNIFQSLGNIYFPLNTSLIPGYILSAVTFGGSVNKVASYLIFSIEIFCAIYIFCTKLRFKQSIAILSSWLFVILAFPCIKQPALYGIFSIVPHFCSSIAETFILMFLIANMVSEKKISWICGLSVLLLLMHFFIAYPGMLMMAGPSLALFSLCYLVSLKTKSERFVFICSMVMIIVILALMGFFHYFLGLFQYTAAVFFPNELFNNRSDWYNVSIAFQRNFHGITGLLLVSFALLGAIFEVVTQRGLRQNLAIMFLVYLFSLFLFGFTTIFLYHDWHGPVPLYFEFCVWPFYIIYTMVFLSFVLLQMKNLILRKNFGLIEHPIFQNMAITLPVAILAIYLILSNFVKYPLQKEQYPPSNTAITKILRKEQEVFPASLYQGRVASLTGQGLSKLTWFDLHALDAKVIEEIGNEHRLVGLSYYNIPSLFEYNPLITPPFYLFTKRFLAHLVDDQMRNVMVLRKVDEKILSLLGVRFFITDEVVKTKAALRFQINEPTLFLYELQEVNLGQYSPTKILFIPDIETTLNTIAEPVFDPKTSVIIHNPEFELENLVPATETKMTIEDKGLIKLYSKSKGASLLVLPIEYSRCLKLNSEQNPTSKIFRVNLLETGLLFQGELKAELHYFTGPLNNASCRLEDVAEIKKMQ